MRGPLTEIPEQAFLAFGLGAKFENLLFPEQVERKRSGNRKREFLVGKTVEIPGHAGVEENVAGLVELDQLLTFPWCNGRIIELILQIIHVALKKRVLGENINNAEGRTPDRDDVQATVFVAFDNFENFRGATHANDSIREGEEHPEGGSGVQAFAHHAAITRLKNVQRKLFAGEEYDVEREERNAFRPHGSHGESYQRAWKIARGPQGPRDGK
jgi:hypothetical protein